MGDVVGREPRQGAEGSPRALSVAELVPVEDRELDQAAYGRRSQRQAALVAGRRLARCPPATDCDLAQAEPGRAGGWAGLVGAERFEGFDGRAEFASALEEEGPLEPGQGRPLLALHDLVYPLQEETRDGGTGGRELVEEGVEEGCPWDGEGLRQERLDLVGVDLAPLEQGSGQEEPAEVEVLVGAQALRPLAPEELGQGQLRLLAWIGRRGLGVAGRRNVFVRGRRGRRTLRTEEEAGLPEQDLELLIDELLIEGGLAGVDGAQGGRELDSIREVHPSLAEVEPAQAEDRGQGVGTEADVLLEPLFGFEGAPRRAQELGCEPIDGLGPGVEGQELLGAGQALGEGPAAAGSDLLEVGVDVLGLDLQAALPGSLSKADVSRGFEGEGVGVPRVREGRGPLQDQLGAAPGQGPVAAVAGPQEAEVGPKEGRELRAQLAGDLVGDLGLGPRQAEQGVEAAVEVHLWVASQALDVGQDVAVGDEHLGVSRAQARRAGAGRVELDQLGEAPTRQVQVALIEGSPEEAGLARALIDPVFRDLDLPGGVGAGGGDEGHQAAAGLAIDPLEGGVGDVVREALGWVEGLELLDPLVVADQELHVAHHEVRARGQEGQPEVDGASEGLEVEAEVNGLEAPLSEPGVELPARDAGAAPHLVIDLGWVGLHVSSAEDHGDRGRDAHVLVLDQGRDLEPAPRRPRDGCLEEGRELGVDSAGDLDGLLAAIQLPERPDPEAFGHSARREAERLLVSELFLVAGGIGGRIGGEGLDQGLGLGCELGPESLGVEVTQLEGGQDRGPGQALAGLGDPLARLLAAVQGREAAVDEHVGARPVAQLVEGVGDLVGGEGILEDALGFEDEGLGSNPPLALALGSDRDLERPGDLERVEAEVVGARDVRDLGSVVHEGVEESLGGEEAPPHAEHARALEGQERVPRPAPPGGLAPVAVFVFVTDTARDLRREVRQEGRLGFGEGP